MDGKYRQALLAAADRLSSKADVFESVKTLAQDIAERDDDAGIVGLLRVLSIGTGATGKVNDVLSAVRAVHDALLMFCGYRYVRKVFDRAESMENDSRSLPELLAELDALVGLHEVKRKVRDLVAYQHVQGLRRANGLKSQKGTLHLAFIGNPGTGKTTVARIIGRIYRHIGLLSKGHFVEASRTDLIAGYQGQTALKVKRIIEKSRGGVLFIDEAYSITENDHSDSYGRECLTELTKALEDCRDDLVVIVAGYSKPMEKFFESNPGLKSRFNTFIEFEDYSKEELAEIFRKLCRENDYSPTEKLMTQVLDFFAGKIEECSSNFANGRLARNLFDNIVMNHARRCVGMDGITVRELSELKSVDMVSPSSHARGTRAGTEGGGQGGVCPSGARCGILGA